VDVGPLEQFSRDGVYDQWADAKGFFVIRQGGRLHALSATCTHRRYDLEAKGYQLVCPKHGSLFTASGQVIKGPATIPLPRFAIRLSPSRNVIVDPGRQFRAEEAGAPEASVVIPT
jgi:nitrite reductase/ring-hydroxylating ferredoxin subunit